MIILSPLPAKELPVGGGHTGNQAAILQRGKVSEGHAGCPWSRTDGISPREDQGGSPRG